jgi:hypothetical protein
MFRVTEVKSFVKLVPGRRLASIGVEVEENGAENREKDSPRMLRITQVKGNQLYFVGINKFHE